MIKPYKILFLSMMALLAACSSDEDVFSTHYDALEMKGIQVAIAGGEASVTRAATVDPLKVSVGRTQFVNDDEIVFTTIKRTKSPLDAFTYSNIHYKYNGTNWERTSNGTNDPKKDPEKIYWTDGNNAHTFIAYNLPDGYHWETAANGTGSDTYAGELGYGATSIVYSSNENIQKEDPLILYSDTTKADNGGLTTTVYFTHALSNVRVVVNIKDFAASASAVDTLVKVSNMVLHDQPCLYTWGASSKDDVTALDFNADQQKKKDITLWCPQPNGEGKAQSKTFTFYGLTTPQNAEFHKINGNKQPLKFSFEVEYPDAMDPTQSVKKTYQGEFGDTVHFNPGVCTTLNISLNHQNERMYMDVEYSDWNFVATPDLGALRKKSTFMDINSTVTIHSDANATIDDATWLYQKGPYRITSASQLLSFAKEVKAGVDFKDKFIRLDADITMQASTAKTSAEDSTSNVKPVVWIGIGDADHAFNGTFLGGDRYINRLNGNPLFAKLGPAALVEQLHITSIGSITGGGALTDTNAGVIGGCKVVDDVMTTGGALVGSNSGLIYACYSTGEGGTTKLIGENSAKAVGCYQSTDFISLDESNLKKLVDTLNGDLDSLYVKQATLTQYKYIYSAGSYPTVQKQ
ncbi:fimbrillin family protein [uncultured Prevotella sp.]|uniref:fimbrillin family protein n=1 Tax=uncultured Prevotella sp. TaxID=159272 RepID=UPI00258703A0|nr:fimbrillin family protein [uncultured Prevotella sp.]